MRGLGGIRRKRAACARSIARTPLHRLGEIDAPQKVDKSSLPPVATLPDKDGVGMRLTRIEARVVAALPQTMGSLPELVRQQTRLADLVAQQLMHTRQRDDQVEKTLARITQGVEQQRDVMGLVQQQLDLNHESAMKVADGVTTLATAVVHLQGTTDRSSAALQGLLERTAERDAGIQKLHTTLQNWMLFVAILTCMTLFGLVILVWVVLDGGRAPVPAASVAPVAAAAAPADAGPGDGAVPAGAPAEPAPATPTATTIPALGGATEPASGAVAPATGGAAAVP